MLKSSRPDSASHTCSLLRESVARRLPSGYKPRYRKTACRLADSVALCRLRLPDLEFARALLWVWPGTEGTAGACHARTIWADARVTTLDVCPLNELIPGPFGRPRPSLRLRCSAFRSCFVPKPAARRLPLGLSVTANGRLFGGAFKAKISLPVCASRVLRHIQRLSHRK